MQSYNLKKKKNKTILVLIAKNTEEMSTPNDSLSRHSIIAIAS